MVSQELNICVDKIRDNIPCLKNIISFNTGMDGPLLKSTFEAINESLKLRLESGTFTKEAVKTFYDRLIESKIKIADFVTAKSENICLTPNTSFGMNIALNAFDWNSDSEIIASKEEYSAVLFSLYNIRQRYNTKITLIDLALESPCNSILKQLSQKTKAVVLSHVFWQTGNLLKELKEIILELRKKNIISIIDGAQSVGVIKVNLNDLEPDFYCAPGHKWLMGPKGTGFVYINQLLFNKRPPYPSVIGFDSSEYSPLERLYDLNFNWTPKKNASLFEFGGLCSSLFSGLSRSIDFANDNLKSFDIFKQIQVLTDYLIERLSENPKLEVVTSKYNGGLVSFKHKTLLASDIVTMLWEKERIVVRELQGLNTVRISVHYFNTKEEIDLLVQCLK